MLPLVQDSVEDLERLVQHTLSWRSFTIVFLARTIPRRAVEVMVAQARVAQTARSGMFARTGPQRTRAPG